MKKPAQYEEYSHPQALRQAVTEIGCFFQQPFGDVCQINERDKSAYHVQDRQDYTGDVASFTLTRESDDPAQGTPAASGCLFVHGIIDLLKLVLANITAQKNALILRS